MAKFTTNVWAKKNVDFFAIVFNQREKLSLKVKFWIQLINRYRCVACQPKGLNFSLWKSTRWNFTFLFSRRVRYVSLRKREHFASEWESRNWTKKETPCVKKTCLLFIAKASGFLESSKKNNWCEIEGKKVRNGVGNNCIIARHSLKSNWNSIIC